MNIKYYQILSFGFLLSNVYLIVCPAVIFLFSISPSVSFRTVGTLAFKNQSNIIGFLWTSDDVQGTVRSRTDAFKYRQSIWRPVDRASWYICI